MPAPTLSAYDRLPFEELTVKKQKKVKYVEKLLAYLSEYKNFLIINVDNVGSKQLQQVRIALRGRAKVLMGKNVSIDCLAWVFVRLLWCSLPTPVATLNAPRICNIPVVLECAFFRFTYRIGDHI